MNDYLREILKGVVIGCLSASIIYFMNIDITGIQTGILVASIVIITTVVNLVVKKYKN